MLAITELKLLLVENRERKINKVIKSFFILLLATTVRADDWLAGDALIRSLKPFQGSLVLFLNSAGESAQAIVFCLPDEKMTVAGHSAMEQI